MTDNIQKLYEIAGVEKDCTRFKSILQCTQTLTECNECINHTFPPFTAEKQLELIKWLCLNTYRNYIHFRFKQDTNTWIMEYNIWRTLEYESFENALTSVVLSLWLDLTDDQKQEIKRILE